VGQAANGLSNNINGVGQAFSRVLIGSANNTVGSLILSRKALDQLNASLAALVGDASQAGNELEKLMGISNTLGLNFNETANAAKGLLGTLSAARLTDEFSGLYAGLLHARTALGLTTQEFSSLTNSLRKMVNEGVLTSRTFDNLRKIIPNFGTVAASALRMPEEQLKKVIANGELLAAELLPNLGGAFEEAFSAEALKKAQGIEASANRLANAWQEVVGSLIDTGLITNALDSLSRALRENSGSIRQWGENIRDGVEDAVNVWNSIPSEFRTFLVGGAAGAYVGGKLGGIRGAAIGGSITGLLSMAFESFSRNHEDAVKEFGAIGVKRFDKKTGEYRGQVVMPPVPVRPAPLKLSSPPLPFALSDDLGQELPPAPAGKTQTAPKKSSSVAKHAQAVAGLEAKIKQLSLSGREFREWELTNVTLPKLLRDTDGATEKVLEYEKAQRLAWARKDIEDALEKRNQHLEVQADFYAQLSEKTGNYALTTEALNRSIQKQVDVWRNASIPDEYIAQMEELLRLEASRDGWAGMFRATQEYFSSATNLAEGLHDVTISAFSNMEDAIVTFAKTGRLSFSDMVNSMLSDLLRLSIRSAVLGPLSSALGKAIGGLFTGGMHSATRSALSGGSIGMANFDIMTSSGEWHTGGVPGIDSPSGFRRLPAAVFGSAPRYHRGRYWNPATEMPAVIRKDESVLTPGQMRTLAGNAGPQVYVNVINSTGQQAKTHTRTDEAGNKTIDVYVGDMAAKQMLTPGTTLNRAVTAQTGQRRPAIRR